jgi:hypothetical protein
MDDSKYGQESDFLKDGPWDELYVLTQHWKSDLEFYRDDLHFLHNLVDKYFMWLTKTENLLSVKELKRGLANLKNQNADLLAKVGQHAIQLGNLIENIKKAHAGIVVTEHEHLEEEMAAFVKSFRKNRKEVFKITEYVIDGEKLADIMGS